MRANSIFFWFSNQIINHNYFINPWKGAWVFWSLNNFKSTFSNFSLILIHGENKHFRYFDGLNVVRYYLASLDHLLKRGVVRDGEFKLAWERMYCDDAHLVLKKNMFRGDLNSINSLSLYNRYIDLTYIGKAHLWGGATYRLKNTILLTRNWPESDYEYFHLLSKTKFLFSYDHITSVTEDAILLGALPIFLNQSLRFNEIWLATMNKNFGDCFLIHGDVKKDYLDRFIPARNRFIENIRNEECSYFQQLIESCKIIEGFFKINT